jgi:hypothetical protein
MIFSKLLDLLYYMHVYLQMDTCFHNHNHSSVLILISCELICIQKCVGEAILHIS